MKALTLCQLRLIGPEIAEHRWGRLAAAVAGVAVDPVSVGEVDILVMCSLSHILLQNILLLLGVLVVLLFGHFCFLRFLFSPADFSALEDCFVCQLGELLFQKADLFIQILCQAE